MDPPDGNVNKQHASGDNGAAVSRTQAETQQPTSVASQPGFPPEHVPDRVSDGSKSRRLTVDLKPATPPTTLCTPSLLSSSTPNSGLHPSQNCGAIAHAGRMSSPPNSG